MRSHGGIAVILALGAAQPALALTERDCVDYVSGQAALMYRVPAGNVSVRWEGPRLAELAPAVPPDATLSLGNGIFKLTGTIRVPLQVWRKGARVATIYPRLAIDVQQEVAVTTGRIPRGAVLDASRLRLEKRPIGSLSSQPFTTLDGVLGSMARLDIVPGTVLTGALIDLPPLIKSGRTVSVRLVSGGLLILGSGQALQDGRSGQLVRVLNTKSQRDFLARVVAPDVVQVDLAGDEAEEAR